MAMIGDLIWMGLLALMYELAGACLCPSLGVALLFDWHVLSGLPRKSILCTYLARAL